MRKVAFIGLPLFALSLTFGAFDWLMSLNYHWFSTMWGVYIFAGAAGSSMSLLVLVITALRRAGYLKDIMTLEHYHIMGKWMLSFTRFLGLHRLQPVHAHLVREHPGRDRILHSSKHRVVVGAEPAPGHRTLLYPFCDSSLAVDQKGAAASLLGRGLDPLHADARHVHHRPARATRHRRSPQHLGFAFPHRHRRNARLCLSANCASDFSLSSSRSAPD